MNRSNSYMNCGKCKVAESSDRMDSFFAHFYANSNLHYVAYRWERPKIYTYLVDMSFFSLYHFALNYSHFYLLGYWTIISSLYITHLNHNVSTYSNDMNGSNVRSRAIRSVFFKSVVSHFMCDITALNFEDESHDQQLFCVSLCDYER